MAVHGHYVPLSRTQTAFQFSHHALKHKGPTVNIKTRQSLGCGEKCALNSLSYKCITDSELYVTNVLLC